MGMCHNLGPGSSHPLSRREPSGPTLRDVPEVSRTFDAHASSVRAARHFLLGSLDAWDAVAFETAGEQVISELATNAALHAHSEFTVHLRLDPDCLVVEVSDSSTVLPQQREYSSTATTGRGLTLVTALSDEWGVQSSPTGKTVWCRITPDQELSLLPDDDLAGADDWTGSRRSPGSAGRSGGDVLLRAA